MIYLVAFVVLVLATARLTRLASKDDLTIPMRMWIDKKFGVQSLLSRMLWCIWCSGVWASLLTTAVAMTALTIWARWPIGGAIAAGMLLVPASAYAASWIVGIETRISDREQ